MNTPQVNAWCGLAFERVCLEHVSQMKQALGISGVPYAIHTTLVTPYGMADGSYTGHIQNVITADDLFS